MNTIENTQKGHSVVVNVALRMFIMQVLARQWHFLAHKNAELSVPLLFWPENCTVIPKCPFRLFTIL